MDRRSIEKALVDYLSANENVVAVYLYGSVARGTDRPDSDVDVGVLFREAPPATLLGQPYADEAELTARLARRVQIVSMNTAPVDLIHRVLRDGALLFERDKSQRIAFEVRARNVYFDLLPVLREYRRKASA